MAKTPRELSLRRARRVRNRLRALRAQGNVRPRLSVFRSDRHIYAQVIDDARGITLAAASTVEKEQRSSLKTGGDKAAAVAVGRLVAQRAKDKGVTHVVLDRGSYPYHGRIAALADAAREAGLDF